MNKETQTRRQLNAIRTFLLFIFASQFLAYGLAHSRHSINVYLTKNKEEKEQKRSILCLKKFYGSYGYGFKISNLNSFLLEFSQVN